VSSPRAPSSEAAAAAKAAAARAGAEQVESGMVVGLGTGSTTALCIEELGRRSRQDGLRFVGIPTSYSAARLGRQAGLDVRTLEDVEKIDLALDGADEVGPDLNLIKGGGAAHTQEKVIATMAERFVVLVDDSKLVARLGAAFPVPLEVLGFALRPVLRAVASLGGEAQVRVGSGKDGPVISDRGNPIVDAAFPGIEDPASLASRLDAIPGLVAHGLFVSLADEVLIGMRSDGSVQRKT